MKPYSRKEFISTSALALAGAFGLSAFDYKKKLTRLSFSTLGCPDWSMAQIATFAAKHGYTGIEVRGIQREMDLPKCKEFNSVESRTATMKLMKDNGLQFINLGSSATLHFADTATRAKHIDDGKRFIDLAQQLDCPYIRVFPNNFPKEQEKKQTMDLISSGLAELGEYAKGSKVKVLMETHGDMVRADDIVQVMEAANHPGTGLIWDVSNMWTITKEAPADVYPKLKKYIYHLHVKDAKLVDDKLQYVFLGKGDVPIMNALDILSADNYKGFYSFEWEKLWHPEIAEPELALADYPQAIKSHFK
jgi:sugar phosphate isomerase/epimerase